MATNIKTKFSGIGRKADGSQISSTEWNGVITESELINASNTVNIGKDVVNTIPDAVLQSLLSLLERAQQMLKAHHQLHTEMVL